MATNADTELEESEGIPESTAGCDVMDDSPSLTEKYLSLTDMPEEILEHILSFLSPYREMEMAKQVSKQWNRVIKSTVKQKKRKFHQGLSKCDVQWTEIYKDKPPSYSEKGHIGISDRFSHSAAYYNGFMYVFGGCTSTSTTFNDLWSFDLTHRRWVRPVAMGTYPSPKACATMVVYNGNLVLYGGWSHPIPYPLHQSAHYFSELHVYSPTTNRWAHIHSLGQEPEALGGHSASVVGHLMVVFGGSPRPGMGTNNLWVFNFLKTSWTLQPVARDAIPEPRYGQYQTTLDDSHILIMGGCVGQNRVYTDVWLLSLESSAPWRWSKLTVECPDLGAPQTWCHAACRVNNAIVVVAKSNAQRNTRLVKKVKRKRQDSRQNRSQVSPSSSSSSSSSPSTSPMIASGAAERLFPVGVSGATKIQGVYLHPKLQPQPRRGEVFRSSKTSAPGTSSSEDEGREGETARRPSSSTASGPTNPEPHLASSIRPPPLSSSSVAYPTQGQGTSLSTIQASSTMSASLSMTHQAANVSSSAAVAPSSASHNSLLALQQRLHRECLNLPDPDNHHYVRRRSGGGGPGGWRGETGGAVEDDNGEDHGTMPEGYFHRLHNRWMGGQDAGEGPRENRAPLQIAQQPASLPVEPSPPSPGATSASSAEHSRENDASDISVSPQGAESDNGSSSSSHGGAAPTPSPSDHPQAPYSSHQAQPSPLPNTHPSGHSSYPRPMPSIRPNATSNRQRQLEALQRQEELLRSKSRALAAARGRQLQIHQHPSPPPQQQQRQPAQEQQQQQNNRDDGCNPDLQPGPGEEEGAVGGVELKDDRTWNARNTEHNRKKGHHYDEEDNDDDGGDDDGNDPSTPILIPSKNKMDVHILDISRALSDGVVRWGPLSELQPAGAPDETICCSLVEGRGELALFGGVRRDLSGAGLGPTGVSNMAVSRLYLLHPG